MLKRKLKVGVCALALSIGLVGLVSCGTQSNQGSQVEETSQESSVLETNEETTAEEKTSEFNGKINVYTRDAASGTREGYESIIGFKGELTDRANEVSSNGEMANSVGSDAQGIGYVSLTTAFEENHLKPLAYEGVEASVENVVNDHYKLNRPFAYATRAEDDYDSNEKKELVQAFLAYLTESTDGKEVVLANGGIVDINTGKSWDELKAQYPIVDRDNSDLTLVTGGSTSVEKTLSAALESFQGLAGNFQIKVEQTGSSDGWKRVLGADKDGLNRADIGFASRSFKPEEDTQNAMASGVYCRDAIVTVVNEQNSALTNLTKEQAVSIFTGAVENWDDLK